MHIQWKQHAQSSLTHSLFLLPRRFHRSQGVSVNAKLRHVSEKGTHHELTTPLIAAVSFGQLSFVRDLMTNKNTILQNAYLYSHIRKITTRKSDSGEDIDINGVNFLGQTALMYAAASGDEDMTLYLLKIGADRSITDKEQVHGWIVFSIHHTSLFIQTTHQLD